MKYSSLFRSNSGSNPGSGRSPVLSFSPFTVVVCFRCYPSSNTVVTNGLTNLPKAKEKNSQSNRKTYALMCNCIRESLNPIEVRNAMKEKRDNNAQ